MGLSRPPLSEQLDTELPAAHTATRATLRTLPQNELLPKRTKFNLIA